MFLIGQRTSSLIWLGKTKRSGLAFFTPEIFAIFTVSQIKNLDNLNDIKSDFRKFVKETRQSKRYESVFQKL